jgi:glycosyltransferase involved in cell wall biosynthesis
MYKDKKIAACVPAYNEELLIARVIETMPDFVDYIVVVDDCSKDKTTQTVLIYAARQPERVFLVRHEVNQGVGGAIATGYKWCCERDVDVAVVMAGDAQMDPADLPDLLDPVVANEADYTKGNRLFTGEAWQKIPRVRYLGNAALSMLTKIASGYWNVADSQSGYTAINRKALLTLNWDNMYKRYGQPNDLLVRLNIYDFRVLDVPIKPIYGIGEKSGIRIWKVIPKLSWLLLKLFLWRMKEKYIIRDFHPLVFFYFMGFGLLFMSIPFTIRLFWKWIETSSIPPITALALIFMIPLGMQSIFFAMWFDMQYKNLRRQ